MDIEDVLKKTLEELLIKLQVEYTKIQISEEPDNEYAINIESEDPSILIGYHGLNIQALQHILKVLCWQKCNDQNFNIRLDVDDYKKRQEENVINLANRKIDQVRQNGRPQHLPPMSAYFRKKIHTLCMGAGYEDIETISQGDDDLRHIVIKAKN